MTEQGIELRFWSDHRVEPRAYDVTPPGPGEILVRVSRSQVSAGTEMNFFRHNPADGPLTSSVLGYMAVGRVAAVGDGVTEYAPGDRVITSGTHGSHWLVTPGDPATPMRRYIDHLPDVVSDDEAGFVVLGDIALHGIRRAQLQIDEAVVVLGCGMIGQLTIQLARIAGAWPIIALDLLDDRLEAARTSGATHTINAGDPDAVAQVFALTGGRGAGAVFHCTPVAQVLQTAMEMAAERGKVLLVGSPPGAATIGLQVELLRRELSIIGTYEVGIDEPHGYWPWSRRRNRQICLRLLSTGQLSLRHLITHVRPAAEAEAMFRAMHDGKTPWMGIVFDWDDLTAFRSLKPKT
jgi:2-desacetyl-2-hydroxyethyl bacteriochlorophyllide A dehydrogenase